MGNFETLKIRRVFPGTSGRFVFASYDGWSYEYHFFIGEDGSIKGRTNTETWVDLSAPTAGIIRDKVTRYVRFNQSAETTDFPASL